MYKLIKYPLRLLIIVLFAVPVMAQRYEDYQLRLEPVWTRVADANGEPGSIESVEFSPDGKYIVSGSKYDNSVVMWRTSDGHELWRQYTFMEVERVGWSSDGKYVAAGSEDYLVTVYDSKTGEVIKKMKHEQGIDGLTWSNTSMLLASGEEAVKLEDGSDRGWIRIFEMPSGKEIHKVDFGGTVNELFFSGDDKLLLATGHGFVKIFKTDDWSLVQTLKLDHYVTFITGVFSPDNKMVFVGAKTGDLFIWEWESGELLRKFNHTGKKIETVSWHPSGDYLAFAGYDSYIRLYRVKDVLTSYKRSHEIPVAHKSWAGDHAEYIDFNADGTFLVSAHQSGLIKLWSFMGEDYGLTGRLHKKLVKEQKAIMKSKRN